MATVDIDFFKHVNDQFGHDADDQVLVDFARLLAAHCRAEDLVGRYGGEEFCLLFPGMDDAASAGAAQRLLAPGYHQRDWNARGAVRSRQFPLHVSMINR